MFKNPNSRSEAIVVAKRTNTALRRERLASIAYLRPAFDAEVRVSGLAERDVTDVTGTRPLQLRASHARVLAEKKRSRRQCHECKICDFDPLLLSLTTGSVRRQFCMWN